MFVDCQNIKIQELGHRRKYITCNWFQHLHQMEIFSNQTKNHQRCICKDRYHLIFGLWFHHQGLNRITMWAKKQLIIRSVTLGMKQSYIFEASILPIISFVNKILSQFFWLIIRIFFVIKCQCFIVA